MIRQYGWVLIAQFRLLLLALLLPGGAVFAGAVFGAERTLKALELFVSLQLDHRGQKRPDQAVLEPHQPVTARHLGFEFDPGGGHAAIFGRDLALGDAASPLA